MIGGRILKKKLPLSILQATSQAPKGQSSGLNENDPQLGSHLTEGKKKDSFCILSSAPFTENAKANLQLLLQY